jgi:hypothetical protein
MLFKYCNCHSGYEIATYSLKKIYHNRKTNCLLINLLEIFLQKVSDFALSNFTPAGIQRIIRVYPIVFGLAAWSENFKWYSSLPLDAVVSLFCESV